MIKDAIHKVDTVYRDEFIKKLKPIHDFNQVKEGTEIFHAHSNNPLNFDYFLSTSTYLDRPSIKYHNPLEGRDFNMSAQGWYYWDKETAFNILSSSRDKFQRTLFINGILHNKEDIIDYFINHELLLDEPDENGKTPFLFAANKLNVTLCKKLFDKEVNVFQLDGFEQNALHVSTYIESPIKHEINKSVIDSLEMTKYLIEIGLDVNGEDDIKDTPLLNSINQQVENYHVTELILQNGAKINHQNYDGTTALIYAVRKNHLNIVDLLLKNDADINLVDCQNKKAVDYVGTEEMLELFEQYTNRMDLNTESSFRANSLRLLLK